MTKKYLWAPTCQADGCSKPVHDKGSLSAEGFYCKPHKWEGFERRKRMIASGKLRGTKKKVQPKPKRFEVGDWAVIGWPAGRQVQIVEVGTVQPIRYKVSYYTRDERKRAEMWVDWSDLSSR